MDPIQADARRDLETIRGLMERARHYRHLPAPAAIVAGMLAVVGAGLTQRLVEARGLEAAMANLGFVWGGVFVLSVLSLLAFVKVETRREGVPFWSPLAAEVALALLPPFVAAVALTVALLDRAALIPPLWMLCYGVGAMAAGAFARPAVRGLGVAFLAAGIADLAYPVAPAVALGATFGLLHLVFGCVLFLKPSKP